MSNVEYFEYYKTVWRKFAVFSGRAGRAEYWYFVLFNIIIFFLLGVVDGFFGSLMNSNFSLFSSLYFLAVLIPSLAVGVRRLHDIGKSGWWYLVAFVPIIGWIILLVFAIQEGESAKNVYGDVPKAFLTDGKPGK